MTQIVFAVTWTPRVFLSTPTTVNSETMTGSFIMPPVTNQDVESLAVARHQSARSVLPLLFPYEHQSVANKLHQKAPFPVPPCSWFSNATPVPSLTHRNGAWCAGMMTSRLPSSVMSEGKLWLGSHGSQGGGYGGDFNQIRYVTG